MNWPISKRNKTILDGILANNSIANGYIFSGVTGSFIAQAAAYFIYAANCSFWQQKKEPCLECSTCKKIYHKTAVDLATINPEKTIKVEDIRALKERIKYGPTENNYLFVLIHQANLMNKEAANAFLKTLEEPANNVCFILLTNNMSEIIPTIQSRCQIIEFAQLPLELINQYTASLETENLEDLQQKCFYNNELLKYYLESKDLLLPAEYVCYQDLLNKTAIERLAYAEILAKSKEHTLVLLLTWMQEIIASSQSIQNQALEHLDLLVENISQMKYNLNLRLHLENLFIKLGNS